MTRQAARRARRRRRRGVPLLGRAIPLIGHFQIRNRGTVGGSIAHADPASELPAVALALDATLRGRAGRRAPDGRGRRLLRRHVDDRRRPTTSSSPRCTSRCGPGASRLRRRRGRAPRTATSPSPVWRCAVELDDDGTVRRAPRSALFGVARTPVRAGRAEAALVGQAPTRGLDRRRARPRGRARPVRRRARVGRVPHPPSAAHLVQSRARRARSRRPAVC